VELNGATERREASLVEQRACKQRRREQKQASNGEERMGKRATAKRAKGNDEGYRGAHHSQANVTIVGCWRYVKHNRE
jgi:hypothetical protein